MKDEQGLAAASERTLVGRAADVDVDDEACAIAVSEPGGAVRTLSDDVGPRRGGQHLIRESPALKVAPCVGASSQARPARPPLRHRDRGTTLVSRALVRGEVGSNSGKGSQHLTNVAEVEVGFEVLNETEDVTLGVSVWVPPAHAGMRDNDDLAGPRWYLRQRCALSLLSRRHEGLAVSSTVAQLTPARSSSTSL